MTTEAARGLHVGVTIGLKDAAETLWNNGIKQNAVFLAEALKNCPGVASTSLVNTTNVPITEALPWDLARWPTLPFETAKDRVDVLIELGGQVDAAQTEYLHARGAKLVSYCCGFEYVHAMQSVLFDRPMWGYNLFVNRAYDDIWMIPQVDNISRGYFTTLRRREARVVPFVWDPVFLEKRAEHLPEGGRYIPRPGPRRITITEPNNDVVKFCLYPVFIAEEAFRKRPDAIQIMQVTNAERIAKQSAEFISLMNQLDIVKQHKAVFLGRYDTPEFLSTNTDVVVSHQWENPLNYLYLEVCWQGYPLVHNATMCRDLGYYYEGNDVDAGRDVLLGALERHDSDAASYAARQREAIARFLPSNREVVARYDSLLRALASR
jgi:hypothetical protein